MEKKSEGAGVIIAAHIEASKKEGYSPYKSKYANDLFLVAQVKMTEIAPGNGVRVLPVNSKELAALQETEDVWILDGRFQYKQGDDNNPVYKGLDVGSEEPSQQAFVFVKEGKIIGAFNVLYNPKESMPSLNYFKIKYDSEPGKMDGSVEVIGMEDTSIGVDGGVFTMGWTHIHEKLRGGYVGNREPFTKEDGDIVREVIMHVESTIVEMAKMDGCIGVKTEGMGIFPKPLGMHTMEKGQIKEVPEYKFSIDVDKIRPVIERMFRNIEVEDIKKILEMFYPDTVWPAENILNSEGVIAVISNGGEILESEAIRFTDPRFRAFSTKGAKSTSNAVKKIGMINVTSKEDGYEIVGEALAEPHFLDTREPRA